MRTFAAFEVAEFAVSVETKDLTMPSIDKARIKLKRLYPQIKMS